jgi:hypothetical protein
VVDRNGWAAWLASTEKALPFYTEYGFQADEVLRFDMRPYGYGGDRAEKHIPMTRPAISKR